MRFGTEKQQSMLESLVWELGIIDIVEAINKYSNLNIKCPYDQIRIDPGVASMVIDRMLPDARANQAAREGNKKDAESKGGHGNGGGWKGGRR